MINKANLTKKLLFIALSLFLNISFLAYATNTQAKESKESKVENTAARQGLPFRRAGGGTRGNNCLAEQTAIALVPTTPINLATRSDNKLFFYIPPTQGKAEIEFVLRDVQDNLIHEQILVTEGKAGIVALDLPTNLSTKSLKLNSNYRWYFSLICNPENRSQDIVLEGWIKQIQPDSSIKQSLSLSDKVDFYLEANLWYDALNLAAELKFNQTDNSKWLELLHSIGLSAVAQQPILNLQSTFVSN
ncbi:MAG: DUF928 domain-containing protein [Cyanobacteria bacterium J083]|nr:MAG: DUF928 domain-containing protein [Cyanobacteria bacterium J083]